MRCIARTIPSSFKINQFFLSFSIPLELKNGNLQYSQCTMYNLNYTDILKNYQSLEEAIIKETPAEIVPCRNGWSYDKNVYKNTVVSEVTSFVLTFFKTIYVSLLLMILYLISLSPQ